MPYSRGDLSLSVPAPFLAWGSSDQSPQCQRVHTGGLVEWPSGNLLSGGDTHSVWLHNCVDIVISRGIVGGVLHMFNQNKYYWTLPKWLSSSAVSPSDGGPPAIWHLLLRTSVGGATMQNQSWVWPDVGMLGQAGQEQCFWCWNRWWDSKTKQKNFGKTSII